MMAAKRTPIAPKSLIERLPPVRGRLTENAPLSQLTWFRVGGPAEVMFRPADVEDLAQFLAHKPKDVKVTVIGVASKLLIRDGGVKGVVVRLGRGFVEIQSRGEEITAGAGALDVNVALSACAAGSNSSPAFPAPSAAACA
jgi:UDP-N-acetylmuramate dehydrogenase